MKSEWKVTSNSIKGNKMYGVYRIRDTSAVDHSGNREYAGEWVHNRETAAIVAAGLNKIENKEDVRRCRVCGCTDDHACPGGCYWVEDDLCSECVEVDEEESKEETK